MKLRFPVVIIDDDEAVRNSLDAILTAHGNAVRCYESGATFLLRETGKELFSVLLDIRMDGMTGLGVHRSIARFERPIPVVAMSAHQAPEIISEMRRLGAVDVLEKPFTSERMFEALFQADTLLAVS